MVLEMGKVICDDVWVPSTKYTFVVIDVLSVKSTQGIKIQL